MLYFISTSVSYLQRIVYNEFSLWNITGTKAVLLILWVCLPKKYYYIFALFDTYMRSWLPDFLPLIHILQFKDFTWIWKHMHFSMYFLFRSLKRLNNVFVIEFPIINFSLFRKVPISFNFSDINKCHFSDIKKLFGEKNVYSWVNRVNWSYNLRSHLFLYLINDWILLKFWCKETLRISLRKTILLLDSVVCQLTLTKKTLPKSSPHIFFK